MNQTQRRTQKIPWYLISIISFFILPVIWLLKTSKNLNKQAFLKTILIVIVLGYAWSMLVSSSGWWTFNPSTMLGIYILPFLPFEEFLFYPLGGALSVLIYNAFLQSDLTRKIYNKRLFWGMIIATGTAALAVVVSTIQQGKIPIYIISQLGLYNGLSLGFWPWGGSKVEARSALFSIAIMTVIGFLWNWLGFTQTWWFYHATLGWEWPAQVPVDDWNFYLFAPLAAISLYEWLNAK
jgi:lycopene cyclase domain-containing protein